MTVRREAMLLVAACAIAYSTGLGDIAFYTRGEPREGLVVREILRTGAWLVPARPDAEIARKPPLFYWIAAPALRALPDRPELALRLPSAILATAAVLAIWAATRAVAGHAAALPAALVLATAFEWARAATSARVDMVLAASLAVVLAAWMLRLAGAGRGSLVVAAVAAALATLAKGPVALVLPGLAAIGLAAWERDRSVLHELGVARVLGGAAAVAALWYAVAFAQQGREFLDVIVRENVVRFIDSDDARIGHTHGPLYLWGVGLVGLLPWVPLLPLARAAPRTRAMRLVIVWAAVVVVFFSLANAKRSVYLLPAFPALAILVGAGAVHARASRGAVAVAPLLAVLAAVTLGLAAGFDAAAPLGRWLRPDDARGADAVLGAVRAARGVTMVLALATLGGAVLVERARRAGAWPRLVGVVAALAVGWIALFDGVVHPAVARTRSVRELMATVDHLIPPDASLATPLPADPGLRFYAPRPLVPFEAEGGERTRYLLLWQDDWRRLRDEHGRPLEAIAVSAGAQARRGALALVVAPPGRLVRAPESPPAGEPGLKTDSRPP